MPFLAIFILSRSARVVTGNPNGSQLLLLLLQAHNCLCLPLASADSGIGLPTESGWDGIISSVSSNSTALFQTRLRKRNTLRSKCSEDRFWGKGNKGCNPRARRSWGLASLK